MAAERYMLDLSHTQRAYSTDSTARRLHSFPTPVDDGAASRSI
jgi:hypothetical protein